MVDRAGETGDDEKLRRSVRRRAKRLISVVDLDDGSPQAAALMLQELLQVGHAINELIAARVRR